MEVVFTEKAMSDFDFWRKSGNAVVQNKITQLIAAILKSPYSGLGKPEPLKYRLAGTWSRRINIEHRLVYEIVSDRIVILSLKGHYE